MVDLDIKTAVNKIGEIVNFSQILNSLYWDNVYHGQSHEDNFDLYCDICTLNIMSGIEIDSAKKEFQISNAAELRRIREKYKMTLTDSDGKHIKPSFFLHILRASGKKEYINTDSTVFKEFETPMDYLKRAARTYNRPENRLKPFLPFGVLLKREGFRKDNVYEPSIKKTFELIEEYQNQKKIIFSSDNKQGASIDKGRLWKELSCEKFRKLEKIKYNYSTIFKLLYWSDTDKCKNFGITFALTLFRIRHADFYDALLISEEPIQELVEDANGDIEFYNCRYKKFLRRVENGN